MKPDEGKPTATTSPAAAPSAAPVKPEKDKNGRIKTPRTTKPRETTKDARAKWKKERGQALGDVPPDRKPDAK